ncbi:hypothetical protein MYX04_11960 [Nitrospiraceae bacterium AH_259_D15_M11_P09]|nr:hypothetical protein [Nitrospiraceae bacterium AH_259_D15_M11_P09]
MRRRPVLVIHHVMTVAVGFALMTACKPNLAATQQSQPRPSDVPPSVQVTTNKLSYRHGEQIHVTISNDLRTVIYIPTGPTYCSVVSVQRLESGQWVTEGTCPAGGRPSFLGIVPNGRGGGVLRPGPRAPGPQRPLVSEPSKPGVFEKDLRTLPTVKPWKPGDAIREVPRGGGILYGEESLPFSPLLGEIGPGTYRILFRFTVDAPGGPVQTVYSKEFLIDG